MVERSRWWYHSTHHSRSSLSSLPVESARVAGTRHLTCDTRSCFLFVCRLKDLRSGYGLTVLKRILIGARVYTAIILTRIVSATRQRNRTAKSCLIFSGGAFVFYTPAHLYTPSAAVLITHTFH